MYLCSPRTWLRYMLHVTSYIRYYSIWFGETKKRRRKEKSEPNVSKIGCICESFYYRTT